MREDVPTIEPGMSIQALVERHIAADFERAYVVVLGDTFQGLITVTDVKKVPHGARGTTWVSQAMTPAPDVIKIHPTAPLESGLGILSRRGFRQLVVMEDDVPVGLLTRSGVARVMEVTDVLPREAQGSGTNS